LAELNNKLVKKDPLLETQKTSIPKTLPPLELKKSDNDQQRLVNDLINNDYFLPKTTREKATMILNEINEVCIFFSY
jgi:hypothetical protein